MTNLSAPRFTHPDVAREYLEALHWPQGAFCPHCGAVDVKKLPDQRGRPSKAHPEGAVRKGVHQCNACRQQFTVTVNTVFSDSKVPLNKWLLANHLMCASKKGISAHQLHRMLGVTYKTAWFMAHRIREAMTTDNTAAQRLGNLEVGEKLFRNALFDVSPIPWQYKSSMLKLVHRNKMRIPLGSAHQP